jgi:hypothetical protein
MLRSDGATQEKTSMGCTPGTPRIQRKNIDLNHTSAWAEFDCRPGAALLVTARRMTGAGGIGLNVQYLSGGRGPFDFRTGAESIASTYAGAVHLSSAKMEGISRIRVSAASAAGASSYVEICVEELA